MTTLHLGIEELIARQHAEAMPRTVRHAWHLTEFWRSRRQLQPAERHVRIPAWAGELVELSTAQARWALI